MWSGTIPLHWRLPEPSANGQTSATFDAPIYTDCGGAEDLMRTVGDGKELVLYHNCPQKTTELWRGDDGRRPRGLQTWPSDREPQVSMVRLGSWCSFGPSRPGSWCARGIEWPHAWDWLGWEVQAVKMQHNAHGLAVGNRLLTAKFDF